MAFANLPEWKNVCFDPFLSTIISSYEWDSGVLGVLSLQSQWGQFVSLIAGGDIRVSEHGYDALADDGLTIDELLSGASAAVVVEEYPDYPKGSAVLVLQKDSGGNPVHAVWGIPRGYNRPVVLVTAYRPDAKLWNPTFTRRARP